MKKKILYYYNEFEYWYMSLRWTAIVFAAWLIIGLCLSQPFFDEAFFAGWKVLKKSEVLSYLEVLLAIQIPLFFLFIERMSNSGYINRKMLPQVTNFREILVAMIISSTLLLLSPQEAYIYAPTVLLILLSLFGLYRAATVIFQPERFKPVIENHLSNKIHECFDTMLRRRKDNNKFHEDLKTYSYIEMSFLSRDAPKGMKALELRAAKSGYLLEINLEQLSRVFIKEFSDLDKTDVVGDQNKDDLPSVKLRVFPGTTLRKGSIIAKLLVPESFNDANSLADKTRRAFRIVNEVGADIQWFDDLISEFEEQLNLAVSTRNVLLLDQTFDTLQILLDRVDGFVKSKQEDDYGFDSAMKELSYFVGDDLGKRIEKLFEIIADLMTKSFREDQPDTNREIIRFIYRNVLDAVETQNITSIARYDRLMMHGLQLFAFKNAWNKQLSASQSELRSELTDYVKEHTSLLLYQLKQEKRLGINQPKIVLHEWISHRIRSLRNLLMVTYKNSDENFYNSLINILIKADDEGHYDRLDEQTDTLIKSNVAMLVAYFCHRSDLGSVYAKAPMELMRRWGGRTQTKILLHCVEQDYSHAWRIGTFDHPVDGTMHMVPDYADVIRRLWVELMLRDGGVVNDPEYYGDKGVLEQTTFFTNGHDNVEDNTLLKFIDELQDRPHTADLKELVMSFMQLRWNWESNKLADEQLDTEKVEKFKRIVLEAYNERSIAAKLFKDVLDRSGKAPGFKQNGVNQIFDKEAFIKEWHSGYITDPMATQLGEGIASNQDDHVFSKLFKAPIQYQSRANLVAALKKRKGIQWAVVANGVSNWKLRNYFSKFLSADNPTVDEIYFSGIRQKLPVQTIYSDDLPEGVYFVDSKTLGKITVKSANFEEPIRVEIIAFSQSKSFLDGLMKQAPDWLTQKGAKQEQIAFLKTKVRLLVERILKYTPPRSVEVHFIKVSDLE